MPESESIFLVNPYSDPVIVRIKGRGSYQNCRSLADFFKQTVASGLKHFIVDFAECTAMDSTFLGILAGTAIEIRRLSPPGYFIMLNLSERNLELIKNLGLHMIASVETERKEVDGEPLTDIGTGKIQSTEVILKAHESLAEICKKNQEKFQDVISFLKNQIE